VNKGKIAVILIALLLILILSGCLVGNKQVEDNTSPSNNAAPVPVVTAPEKAYFGDAIVFDASKSHDPDGTIESYGWFFEDNKTADGVAVSYTYNFPNDFHMEYPIIYSVVLSIVDNNGSWEYTAHEIMLYPKEYKFYLDSGKLTTEKPSSNTDKIRASFGKFNLLQELTYNLPDFVEILPCTWNATIYVEKPRLTIVNRVLLTLYNETGEKITESDSSFRLFDFWKEKTMKIQGRIDNPDEFKSIKLVVYGFSIGKKVTILYGGEKASQICFNFAI
jgi:hypothetical protein